MLGVTEFQVDGEMAVVAKKKKDGVKRIRRHIEQKDKLGKPLQCRSSIKSNCSEIDGQTRRGTSRESYLEDGICPESVESIVSVFEPIIEGRSRNKKSL